MLNFKHQQRIIDLDPKKFLLAHGTGSGKTSTILQLAKGKTLVVCPKTQFEDRNWQKELLKAHVVGKTDPNLELTVISKEKFRKIYRELPKYDTFIGEECHTLLGVQPAVRYKNREPFPRSSQLFEAARWYIQTQHPPRVYLCSATPAPQPMAVWGAGVLLFKYRYDSFLRFRSIFYFPIKKGHNEIWVPKKDQASKDRLIKAIRSLGDVVSLQDCFDVPEQTFVTRYVSMTPEQKKVWNTIDELYPDPLVLRTKRYMIENGVLNTQDVIKEGGVDKVVMVTDVLKSNKLEELDRLTQEFNKVLIFATFTTQLETIANHFKAQKKTVFVLTGKTKDRGELLSKAEESEECVFIAQSSISAGYELPSFSCVVFASLSSKHLDYVQAQGRVLRANNLKKNLYVHIVVKGGVDEKAYETIMDKNDFHLQLTNGEEL